MDGRCAPAWRSDPGRTALADPVVVGDVVFTSSLETGFEAFPCVSPCRPLVSLDAPAHASIVAPTDDLVAAVGEDGTVRAFGAPRH